MKTTIVSYILTKGIDTIDLKENKGKLFWYQLMQFLELYPMYGTLNCVCRTYDVANE